MNAVFRHMKFGSIHLLINNWIPNYKPFFYISYIPIRKNASLLRSFTLLEIYDFLIYEKILMFSFFGLIVLFIESENCSVVSDSLQPRGLYSQWYSPVLWPGSQSRTWLSNFHSQASKNAKKRDHGGECAILFFKQQSNLVP